MRVRPTFTAAAVAVAGALAVACGGGNGAPGSPTPTPTGPSLNVCGVLGAPATTSIINGIQCPTDNTPVVKLNMRDGNTPSTSIGFCSGTIIAPRSILTAAHCVKGGAAVILVFLGSGDQIQAASWAAHPSYAGSGTNTPDVAVLAMPADLPRTPMPLLTSRDARVGEQVVVAGWGNDFNGSGGGVVQRAGATTLSGVTSLFLQTTYSATSASICPGDSGGPLFAQENGAWAIAGVTSAASDVSCNTGKQFYVNVHNASVTDFILAQASGAAQR